MLGHAPARVRGGGHRRGRGAGDLLGPPDRASIAGCYVRNGTITRGSKVRFLREGVVIWKGEIASLRRFKDDAREVAAGLRVRHRARELPGPQAGRHHRDLHHAGDPAGLSHAGSGRGTPCTSSPCASICTSHGRSLKEKRAVVRPIVDRLRHRFHLSVAEVDHHDLWQRAAIGVALVAESHRHLEELLDTVERFVTRPPTSRSSTSSDLRCERRPRNRRRARDA